MRNLSLLLLVAVGCSGVAPGSPADAGGVAAHATDAGTADRGSSDAGAAGVTPDAGPADAGSSDAGVR